MPSRELRSSSSSAQPSPSNWKARTPPPLVPPEAMLLTLDGEQEVRRVVLEAMWEEGYLTEDEKDLHLAVPIDPEDPSVDERDRFIADAA